MGNVTYNEGYRVNDRGQRLLTVEYLCEQAPRALLFWQHGYGEHMGRYRSGALLVSVTPGVWSSSSRSTPLALLSVKANVSIPASSALPPVPKEAVCAQYQRGSS